jgi:hypothetical protein
MNRKSGNISLGAKVAVWFLAVTLSSTALAQGFFYKEVVKDGPHLCLQPGRRI